MSSIDLILQPFIKTQIFGQINRFIVVILVFSINFKCGGGTIIQSPRSNIKSSNLNVGNGLSTNTTSATQSLKPVKELGGICTVNSDCRKNAYICSDVGFCECNEGYRPDVYEKICIGAIGKECMYDNHCITRAYCKGQTICTCKLEFPVVSSDKWSCEEFGSKAGIVSSSWLILCDLLFLQLVVMNIVSAGHAL